jgi:uncharacterized membrane protein YesL
MPRPNKVFAISLLLPFLAVLLVTTPALIPCIAAVAVTVAARRHLNRRRRANEAAERYAELLRRY